MHRRVRRLLVGASVVFFSSSVAPISAQQQASTTPAIAFSSGGFVPGVRMTGTASWHYGSDEQAGDVTLDAYANGQSSMSLHLSGGTRIETQNPFTDANRACTWTSFDRAVHKAAAHNCWLSTVWFLPQITMQAGAAVSDSVASSAVTADGKTTVVHHERHPADVRDKQTADLLKEVSAVDLGIDTATSLPQWLLFKTHPDNDAGTNIQVEIDFSDYRAVNGVTVPFHIQKLINHALVLDIQIAEVQLLSSSSTP